MTDTAAERMRRITGLILLRDPRAADELDALADELHAAANDLRGSLTGNPVTSPGGMGDRVQMNLVGPDGRIKSTSDTGAHQ